MKRISFFSIALVISAMFNVSYAQMGVKELITTVDWHGTEESFIAKLPANIEKDKPEIWEIEKSESNYRLKNFSVCGHSISKSYIRVKQSDKKLFRVNLIVLDDETDITKYQNLNQSLIDLLGKPQKSNSKKNVWLFPKCKVEATFMDVSNVLTEEIEKYIYVINIEPIYTYFVEWTKAIVESNNARSPITQIEYFRTDNDCNVYIKEINKEEIIKERDKSISTPKGEVITFDGGMFCYRPTENDVVYIKSGFAVTYPIRK